MGPSIFDLGMGAGDGAGSGAGTAGEAASSAPDRLCAATCVRACPACRLARKVHHKAKASQPPQTRAIAAAATGESAIIAIASPVPRAACPGVAAASRGRCNEA